MPDRLPVNRIRIGRVSAALANERILSGLGLREYGEEDRGAPMLFVGVYEGADLAAVVRHRGPAVVKFCGGDLRAGRWCTGVLNALPRPRVRVLAGTPLRADAEAAGLRVDLWRNIYIGDASLFHPAPVGPRVYTYCPQARADEYGIDTIRAVAEAFPWLEFVVARWGLDAPLPFANAVATPGWIPQEGWPAVLAGTFCGIRTVRRDGFSVGATELALMGRPVAHVTDMGVPWIEHAPTVEAMVAFVRRCLDTPLPDLAIASAARAHVEDDSWLLTDTAGAG